MFNLLNDSTIMKRTYNQPICALVNVNAQTILMGSGGGKQNNITVSTNPASKVYGE